MPRNKKNPRLIWTESEKRILARVYPIATTQGQIERALSRFDWYQIQGKASREGIRLSPVVVAKNKHGGRWTPPNPKLGPVATHHMKMLEEHGGFCIICGDWLTQETIEKEGEVCFQCKVL